ncbi:MULTISPECIES: lipid-A-disaccharide synthase N-terminal domain-containing protein [Legionella]|uniref:Lipid A biosynthesis protein n=1 Tax=Legionella septentrionalis TaxID=2498109 RepID=A0A433JKA2_9GAMM|nr:MULTISPECIES: lipid-A-disaccharide synthase N-terminal domain-containing protein [Legionella]MCP0914329.1 lipid-A-disaccharide synthase N-terminal domain-containing protein [Legionella sp. 27cVA30]RUQ89009.1 lipid A biosynthesis protein [Legionella septentrionalis]RUR00316.1 lipid A biosynthesis protein [Legionella septentrionalis]RUR11827.1 lipid A biosynthesis protein [Legionella septentrionalis]RUR17514.1 lipid A biosynthesis protein [Legionella septentrionalis]
MSAEYIWLAVGLLGQAIFSARFIVQWLVSEKEKRSVIPVAFWYLSLLGGITLLLYSIYKRDPVFILGQSTGVFIYTRNLLLIQRERVARSEKLRQI